jgi:hypothetical protein
MATRQLLPIFNGATIAKWTRTRGFEQVFRSAESLPHLQAIAEDNLSRPVFWLNKLEYTEGKVACLWRTALRASGERSIQDWMKHSLPHPHEPFKGMRRGRYWEISVEGADHVVAPCSIIRSHVYRPFWELKLMHQLALLLHVYGPMRPDKAARGLCVDVPQAKGAAAALSRNGVIVKGKEPYTLSDQPVCEWIRESIGDDVPGWVEAVLDQPEMIVERLRRKKAA